MKPSTKIKAFVLAALISIAKTCRSAKCPLAGGGSPRGRARAGASRAHARRSDQHASGLPLANDDVPPPPPDPPPAPALAPAVTADPNERALPPGIDPKNPPEPHVVVPKQYQHQMPTSTTTTRLRRTLPVRESFKEDCDNIAFYCMKAYSTGQLCGRTIYYKYHSFKNYCMLDYVNCMERYEVWQVVHMGECTEVHRLEHYLHYPYNDDYFLDEYYVIEDL